MLLKALRKRAVVVLAQTPENGVTQPNGFTIDRIEGGEDLLRVCGNLSSQRLVVVCVLDDQLVSNLEQLAQITGVQPFILSDYLGVEPSSTRRMMTAGWHRTTQDELLTAKTYINGGDVKQPTSGGRNQSSIDHLIDEVPDALG